jgi:hypothetical protein
MDPAFEPEDLEESLLRAGRDVRMSPELRQKTLAALGVGAVGVTSAATAKAGTLASFTSKPAALLGAGLAGAVGVAGVVVAASGWLGGQDAPPPSPQSTEVAFRELGASPTDREAAAERGSQAEAELGDVERTPDGAGDDREGPAPVASPAEPKRRVEPRSKAPEASDTGREATNLGEELAQLGRVEAALQAKRPADALARLAEYRERFPRPQLGLEAEVLTIQALAESGARSSARTRATRFLERHPTSPLGARVKRYTE